MHSALLLAIAALPFLGADATIATKYTTVVRCGAQTRNTPTCKNSIFGNCCSKSGVCGSTSVHCGKGCQVGFGDCTSAVSTSLKPTSTPAKPSTSSKASTSSTRVISVPVTSPSAPSSPSPASTSPSSSTVVAPSSSVPILSSTPSSLPDVVLTSSILASPTSPSSSAPVVLPSSSPDVKVSPDGSCGGTGGFTCSGSRWGDCCSEYGWCGSTEIYCDAGCNAAFGTCGGVSTSVPPPSTSTSASPSSSLASSSFTTLTSTTSDSPLPTQVVSTNGQCGASNGGMTCLGSTFGDCCSQYAYCGSTSGFCEVGCQSGFGKCDAPPAPGNTCGVEGFANKTEYYASSFNLVPATDISTCAALCLAEAACMSYLFNPGLQNCAYLQYSLSQGEFIAESGTNQFFWDRECAQTATV